MKSYYVSGDGENWKYLLNSLSKEDKDRKILSGYGDLNKKYSNCVKVVEAKLEEAMD